MKKHYWKYILKSFKHDLSRIITITSIVGLGIGFLVGLLSTTPDLFRSMDNYYDKSNFSDITIRSTLGISDGARDALKEDIQDIKDVVLTYEEEKYVTLSGSKSLTKMTYRPLGDAQQLDLLTLEDGDWPESSDECVMLVTEKNFKFEKNKEITYEVEGEEEPARATIVGVVRDPNHITYQSEQSYISGGTIKNYLYFDVNLMETKPEIYTTASIKFNKTTDMDSFSSEYEDYVKTKITEIDAVSKEIIEKDIESLKEKIYTIADEKIQEETKAFILNLVPSMPEETINEIINSIRETDYYKDAVQQEVDKAIKEQFHGIKPQWYILDRDSIKSSYVFKTDALKVQTIAMIFPPFFFLIALLVCLSSMSRIITKDRQTIGTLKALGFTKGRIALKYVLYGLLSSIIGSIFGVAIGLFLIPWALMTVYSTLYYFQSMQFVFTFGYVFGFTALMIGLITAVVLGVVFSNLREPAAQLMLGGKTPKPGRKILIERVPFIWKRLKFKYKSTFRNIFRFKKNLIMMIIGIGGCSGLLLTGFGIRDSFNSISKDQYENIIKYDAVITTKNDGIQPELLFEEEESDIKYEQVMYLHGSCYGEENINVEIFVGDKGLTNFVGFYNTDNSKLDFHSRSVIISEQISSLLGIGKNQTLFLDTDLGTKILPVTGICKNHVSNYIYMGEEAFNHVFDLDFTNSTNNAYIVRLDNLTKEEKQTKLDTFMNNENVKSVIATSETRQTYDDIIDNLGMIVALITIMSGALAAIVIYNLTDININERIREIATLRVCGYSRREVLMYILREILIMSLIGILVGLGIGVFLHWFIIVNISSVGIFFTTTIHWSSYLITIAIATAFVVGISFCFYPKIKRVSMTESLKSVD